MPTPSRASTSDRYSTRFIQGSSASGPHRSQFNVAPAQRNTRGFQPPQSQCNDKTSTSPEPASAPLPKPKVGMATAPTDEQVAPAVLSLPTTAKPEMTKANPDNIKAGQQVKQAALNQSAGDDKLYEVSDEEAPTTHFTSVQPLTRRNVSAHDSGRVGDIKAGDHASPIGPGQPNRSPEVTAKNTHPTVSWGDNKKPQLKFGSSESFAASFATMIPHVDLNSLPRYAWNKGKDPKRQNQARAIQRATSPIASPQTHRTETPTAHVVSTNKPSATEKFDGPAKASELAATSKQLAGSEAKEEPKGVNSSEKHPDPEMRDAKIPQTKAVLTEDRPSTAKEAVSVTPAHVSSTQELTTTEKGLAQKPRNPTTFPQAEALQAPEPRGVSKYMYTPPHLRTPKPEPTQAGSSPQVPKTQAPSIPESHKMSNEGVVVGGNPSEAAESMHSQLPPHLRPPKATKPAAEIALKAASTPFKEEVSNGHVRETKPLGNSIAQPAPSSREDEAKASPAAGESFQVNPRWSSAVAKAAAKKGRKLTKNERIMVDKGYTLPDDNTKVIGGWMDVEETWEERSPHNYGAAENAAKLQEWTNKLSEEANHQPVMVDTSAPEFAQGTYISIDERLEDVIDEAAHITHRLEEDPHTTKKLEKTAQAAIDAAMERKAKEEPLKPKLTREQKAEARASSLRIRMELEKLRIYEPSRPAADIYIRPAQDGDLPDITNIYNWYVDNGPTALEFHHLPADTWRGRIEDTRIDGFELYVAVLRSGRNGNNHGRRAAREPVVGFIYGIDLGGKSHAYRFTAQIQGPFVAKEHLRMGIGRCLFDRMMECMDFNYFPQGACEWRGDARMNKRELKKIMVELPYWDNTEKGEQEVKWKTAWLTGELEKYPLKFEFMGTVKELGFKQHRTVSLAQFIHDTNLDISKRDDPPM